MLGIIITGHGHFASGLYQAATQVIGAQPQVIAVDFPDGHSTQQLEETLRVAIEQCNSGEGVIFLTDILGGSPFRTASLLSMESSNIEVITGCNMPLLVGLLSERDAVSPADFRDQALDVAKNGITSLWHRNQAKMKPQSAEGGI